MPKTLTRKELRRVEAINAAALALGSGNYNSQEELWSLTVFFERYIKRGAKGTLEQFGPKEQEPAEIVHLVQKP